MQLWSFMRELGGVFDTAAVVVRIEKADAAVVEHDVADVRYNPRDNEYVITCKEEDDAESEDG